MIQRSKFLTKAEPAIHKSLISADINTSISAELIWAFITRSGFVDIAWRKVVTPPPAISEIEHQKMAFLQKLVDVVRRSNEAKSSPIGVVDKNPQRSAKIAPNPSNQ